MRNTSILSPMTIDDASGQSPFYVLGEKINLNNIMTE